MDSKNISYIKKILYSFISVIFFLIGIFCLIIYVQEIFNSFNANDKSLLFWYLPFLFVGIISFGISLITVIILINSKSRKKHFKSDDAINR